MQVEMEESANAHLNQLVSDALASMSNARSLSDLAIQDFRKSHLSLSVAELVSQTELRPNQKPDSERIKGSLDAAAQSLLQLERSPAMASLILLSERELNQLIELKTYGRTKEIERRLKEKVKEIKTRIGIRRGPRLKANTAKYGYECAVKVEALLPVFERGMAEARKLQKKLRNRQKIELEMSKLGYSKDQVVCLLTCKKPLTATCKWVATNSDRYLSVRTVQNYYAKYQRILPKIIKRR
jgi:hypothetical protein